MMTKGSFTGNTNRKGSTVLKTDIFKGHGEFIKMLTLLTKKPQAKTY